jgi:hypothetical protein
MLKPSRETSLPFTVIVLAASETSSELIGLRFTNKQIGLTVIGLDADWQAHLDARLRAVEVLRASGVMVDVADHIHDFAADGDAFARLVFVSPRGRTPETLQRQSRRRVK